MNLEERNFDNLKPLVKSITDIAGIYNAAGDERECRAANLLVNILIDVLGNGLESNFFEEVSPHNINIGSNSQIRSQTICSKKVKELMGSIPRNGVQNAIFATKNTTSQSYHSIDGNHRLDAVKKLLEGQEIIPNFKMPCILIPEKDINLLNEIIEDAQLALNDPADSKIGNKDADISKMIDKKIAKGYDLCKESDYDKVLELLKATNKHKTVKSLKNLLTRKKNQLLADRSDIKEATPEEWKAAAIGVFKLASVGKLSVDIIHKNAVKHDRYSGKIGAYPFDGTIGLVSTKGSALDQRLRRDMKYKMYHPNMDLTLIVACQNTKGDVRTVVKSREKIFKEYHFDYQNLGEASIFFDYLLIAPQVMGDVKIETTVGDEIKTVLAKAEHIKSPRGWKVITKDEVIAHWKNNKTAFKMEWIVNC